MYRSLLFASLTILLIAGCGTFNKAPGNDQAPLSELEKDFIQQKTWTEKYRLAKTQTDCLSLITLAKESKYLLQTIANLKAGELCDPKELATKNLPTIPDDLNEKQAWLASLNLQRQLHVADAANDPNLQINAYSEAAKQSSRSSEKLAWLNKANLLTKNLPADAGKEASEKIQERIYHIAPRLLPNPEKKNWFRVGMDFLSQRDFTTARNYFNKIIHDRSFTSDEQYLAFRQLRNSYKIEQNKLQYLNWAGQFLKWTIKQKNQQRISEAYLTLARAQWTEGDVGTAQDTLAATERSLRGNAPMEDIHFIRGRMADERGDHRKALGFYTLALTHSSVGSNTHDKILFNIAWTLRKLHRYEEAAVKFAELAKTTEDNPARYRYQFWQARCWDDAGEADLATLQFQQLAQTDTLGFYGLLAYYKMNQPLPALQKGNLQALDPNPNRLLDYKTQEMIRLLALADEKDLLEKYVNMQNQNLRTIASATAASPADIASPNSYAIPAGGATAPTAATNATETHQQSWLFVLQNLADAGLYQPLFAQISNLPLEVKNQILQSSPETLFPRRYLQLIEPAATKFGIAPEFVLSIIRQESSFDPYARSGADAFGLMQILPSVAKLQEKATGVLIGHHEDLYQPAVNIPVGTALLAELMHKYKGQLVLAAAAYNASEKAIAGWVKTRLKNDPLEFIEDIPYEETRNYVKLVLRNYIFYTRLGHRGETVAFPTQFIDQLTPANVVSEN